eukprot:466892_1
MEYIFSEIIQYLNKKYKPLQLNINKMYNDCDEIHSNKSIIFYQKQSLITHGLTVLVILQYIHQIIFDDISCPYMNSYNPLKCPIYYSMKEKYILTKENLYHLNKYTHFRDECIEKQECKYSNECNAYVRMENGGYNINDKCHMKLYRHPPRNRYIKLSKNIHSFIFHKKKEDNYQLYEPTITDEKKYNFTKSDGFINALIEEVIINGYKYDLCLLCHKNEKCKHLIETIDCKHSILHIVQLKMKHYRHLQINKVLNRAQMLSLILYTGCECNYNLCSSQRSQDYKKWKWFDYCLYNAISKLSQHETGNFPVFSGVNGVKLDQKMVKTGYFVTYVSTSWNKQISQQFMGDNGMIIKIEKEFKNDKYINCCDVSWISKFGSNECEILFARSMDWNGNKKFNCKVLDESDGIQTVLLGKCK